MGTIQNPIIPGMAPDPSILRVGDDYYIATSSFHWLPGIPIYHSKDLVNWQLLTHVLQGSEVNLRGTNTPAGVWAPHLSYDEQTRKFWLVFCHMQNMAGREFNAESYAMSSDDIMGPWSKPLYLTSIGFDPSLYHENGHHYLAVLEWETRSGYQAPGTIVLSEVDLQTGRLLQGWQRITNGFTTRGCVEAPQLYKHGDYYYMMAASGGTGYAHGVEIGRAKDIFGPYEPNPTNEPILTSSPRHLFSLGDPDAGHFEMFNPNSLMQKAGHGSLVETPDHEFYIAHLMSRPLPDTTLNPLGRETSLQKVRWTEDGWLELEDGTNLAKMETPAPSAAPETAKPASFDIYDAFSTGKYSKAFMTPYHQPDLSWVFVENSHLVLSGRGSFFSQNNPSIMATRATSFAYTLQTKLDFRPEHFSQTAGAGLYYDSNNWIYAYIGLNDKENQRVISILQAKLGTRIAFDFDTVAIPEESVPEIRWHYENGKAQAFYRLAETSEWQALADAIDVSYLSDEGVNGEPGEIGGFTGLFNFIGSVDAYQHTSHADFYYYKVENDA
jgi:xylan 1,4-beta-xylosidase